jgi:hypothetical protein
MISKQLIMCKTGARKREIFICVEIPTPIG